MATLQRSVGRRAIRHANVNSKTHAKDVAENNRRRALHWVGFEVPAEDNHRIIPSLGGGLYFVRDHPLYGEFWRIQEELHVVLESIAADYGIKRKEPGADIAGLADSEKRAVNSAKLKRREQFEAMQAPRYEKQHRDLLEVDGDELVQRLDCWHADLSYYRRWQKDEKCRAGHRWKRTNTKGLQGHVIPASPWFSNLIFESAEAGEHEKVRTLAREAAVKLADEYQKKTKRRVISVQAHFDTSSLHWHLFSTRIGEDHHFIKGTTDKFGLIGPWGNGVLRQGENGFIPENSINYLQALRLLTRAGGAPLDTMMYKLVDELCYTAFGASPRLAYWMRVYKQGLPRFAYERLKAVHAGSGAELKKWEQHMKLSEDYVPSAVGFGGSVNGGQEVVLK